MRGLIRQGKFLARSGLGRFPGLFLAVAGLRPSRRLHVVRPDTDLVIEGFPRSGNTFAVAAFELAQATPVRIARHLHAPAQIQCAVKWNVPAIVLIREPLSAVVSLTIRDPVLPVRTAFRSYHEFYHRVAPLRSRIVVARFEDVITDFGEIIDRVNLLYDRRFSRFEHSEANVRRAFRVVEQMDRRDRASLRTSEASVARPSAMRQAKKERRADEIRRQAGSLLERCADLYQSFVGTKG